MKIVHMNRSRNTSIFYEKIDNLLRKKVKYDIKYTRIIGIK